MQAIGDRLREARMRQKIDIADVEAATKIRAKYLRALENEEFGLLPGPTFVKTFLRTYAEYLGLDAQLLVEEYRVQHEPRGEEFAPIRAPRGGSAAARTGRDRRPRRAPPGPGPVIFGLVVLILVIVLVLGLTSPKDDGSNKGKQQQAGQQARQTAAATAAKKKAEERRKRREAAAAKRRAAARMTVRLRIVPVGGPVYVCIVNGKGSKIFGGTLATPQTFKAKHMRINLGRRSVTVTVNKKALQIPPGSTPVGYDLRSGKQPSELLQGQRPTC